jgi:hypothetical protein
MDAPAPLVVRTTALVAASLSPLLVHGALSLDVPGLVAARWNILGRLVGFSLVAASALPHTLAYVTLLSAFAITLLPGREPLVTWLARRISGPLGAEMVAYTRQVTWAWTLFFAAQLLVSLLLVCLAPLGVWSFFVNVLNFPLVALMFAAEYAFRRVHLRDPPRQTVSDLVRVFGYIKESFAKSAAPAGARTTDSC